MYLGSAHLVRSYFTRTCPTWHAPDLGHESLPPFDLASSLSVRSRTVTSYPAPQVTASLTFDESRSTCSQEPLTPSCSCWMIQHEPIHTSHLQTQFVVSATLWLDRPLGDLSSLPCQCQQEPRACTRACTRPSMPWSGSAWNSRRTSCIARIQVDSQAPWSSYRTAQVPLLSRSSVRARVKKIATRTGQIDKFNADN